MMLKQKEQLNQDLIKQKKQLADYVHACQPWSSKVHFLNFLLNIYDIPFIQFWFQFKFTPITGELFILWHLGLRLG
jgi:hypothetical protein